LLKESAAEPPSNRTDHDAMESLAHVLFLVVRQADGITPVVRARLEAILASPDMTDENRETPTPFRW
jgi:hypothetical protein